MNRPHFLFVGPDQRAADFSIVSVGAHPGELLGGPAIRLDLWFSPGDLHDYLTGSAIDLRTEHLELLHYAVFDYVADLLTTGAPQRGNFLRHLPTASEIRSCDRRQRP